MVFLPDCIPQTDSPRGQSSTAQCKAAQSSRLTTVANSKFSHLLGAALLLEPRLRQDDQ